MSKRYYRDRSWRCVSECKLDRLRALLRPMDRVAVAYSGGVDSALLLRISKEVLGDNVIAIMNVSPLTAPGEEDEAVLAARSMGVEALIVRADPLADAAFRHNRTDRCYRCKRMVFEAIAAAARERGIENVIDGTHVDDMSEDRPGRRALAELGIRSPLQEAGLGKEEVRAFARQLSVPSADRPSGPCLATRIPFDQEITPDALQMVGEAEKVLKELGVRSVRVRHHGTMARIEVPPEDFAAIVDMRATVVERLKRIGFIYVAVDLQGFRSGSMSEALGRKAGH